MKVLTIVGARPQFIKAAPMSAELRKRHHEVLVHTGQHYDDGMSDVFFRDLSIPSPDYHLGVGGGSHGSQTAAMLTGLERVMEAEHPDVVLVYGDTNSTLAAAIAAAKLHLPVAHVEAGLRSFYLRMPEEVNRVLTDHVSRWLFAPSDVARAQLAAEGIVSGVHIVGDIMLDVVRLYAGKAGPAPCDFAPGRYFLCTLHRAENVDNPERLAPIVTALADLPLPVVLPLHPRTRARLAEFGINLPQNCHVKAPAPYLEMLALQRDSAAILTDSGGVQKEAYYLGVPCVTLRDETEWVETVENGWNTLVGADPVAIRKAANVDRERLGKRPDLYGMGHCAPQIVEVLERDHVGV